MKSILSVLFLVIFTNNVFGGGQGTGNGGDINNSKIIWCYQDNVPLLLVSALNLESGSIATVTVFDNSNSLSQTGMIQNNFSWEYVYPCPHNPAGCGGAIVVNYYENIKIKLEKQSIEMKFQVHEDLGGLGVGQLTDLNGKFPLKCQQSSVIED